VLSASGQATIDVGEKPHEIDVAPSGQTAYVSNFGLLEANFQQGTPGATISVLDIGRAIERARFRLPAGFAAPHGLKLRPPQCRELFTNAEAGTEGMVVFDAESGAVVRTFPLPPRVHNFLFDAAGSALFAFTLSGQVLRIDPETGGVAAQVETGSPRGLAWTADGQDLIASGKNEILLADREDLAIRRRMAGLGVGQIFYPAATPDGRWILAPAVLDGVVLVIDAASGEVAYRVDTGSPLLAAIHGKQAWVSNVRIPASMFGPAAAREGGVTILDLDTMGSAPIPGIVDANGLAVV
jgi:DNA-binding beta-propeller fold protein YncE